MSYCQNLAAPSPRLKPLAYRDDDAVDRVTRELIAQGKRVFNIYKFPGGDDRHIAELLRLFDPPKGATVLDAGCGIGTVAAGMKVARPDLDFILLNISPAQLRLCPPELPHRIEGSFEAIPLPDASVDAMMMNNSLGHGDLDAAMREAARVVRPGGVLFIFCVSAENDAVLHASLDYRAYPRGLVDLAARHYGFAGGPLEIGPTTSADLAALVGDDVCNRVLAGVECAAYRFVRQPLARPAGRDVAGLSGITPASIF